VGRASSVHAGVAYGLFTGLASGLTNSTATRRWLSAEIQSHGKTWWQKSV